MKHWIFAAALWLGLAPAGAQVLADAPQLAAPGAYAVGVTRLDLVNAAQPDLTLPPAPAGPARVDRLLPLTIWYPAMRPARPLLAHYAARMAGASASGGRTGTALLGAAPIRGQRFPLVILSHGYKGWATGLSDLAESLASKGYVVAGIDHRDVTPSAAVSSAASLGMTVISRSADQRFVAAELARRAGSGPLAGTYDPGNAALIGYSMGGFGAVASAGAGYDPGGPLAATTGGLLTPLLEGTPAIPGLRAVVLLAPWGGSPPLRAWRGAGLARVAIPALVIVGDHDDVSGYDNGVAWIYRNLTAADRWLLTYRDARHNVASDGITVTDKRDFENIERFEEPVWRRDRILAINRHFVTAFLDRVLKHDTVHGAFLDVPVAAADAGVWAPVPGKPADGAFAAAADALSKGYWPGFQRRWALGLELRHDAAAPR